jgi:hypothetical protein
MQNLLHILEKWNLWIVLWFWEQVEAAHMRMHPLHKTHTNTGYSVEKYPWLVKTGVQKLKTL